MQDTIDAGLQPDLKAFRSPARYHVLLLAPIRGDPTLGLIGSPFLRKKCKKCKKIAQNTMKQPWEPPQSTQKITPDPALKVPEVWRVF